MKISERVITVQLSEELLRRFDSIVPVYSPERQSRNEVVRLAMKRLIAECQAKTSDHRGSVPRGE